MEKKKKSIGFKKIIVSILSILFVVCAYVPSIPKVKALSNVTSSNSYGGYTWQIIDTAFDMDGNVTLSSAQISMNLNGHYNGSFVINISLSTIIDTSGIGYTNTINNYGFICNGCRITTYDSSHLYVAITDSNYWEIQIIPIKNASIKNWRSILNAFDILSITGWSMTKLDEITATQISTIKSTLTNVNNNIITTNTRLNTTNTELHNIYNAISSGGTYGSIQSQLYNMGINLSSEIDQTIAIKNKLDSYLSGTIDNSTVSIWDLQNDANYSLSNIETTLNTINSHINDYTSQLNSINALLTSINTNLSNIDSTIDTISWTNMTAPTQVKYSYDGSSYSDWDTNSNIAFNSNQVIYLQMTSNAYRYNRLYKLVLPFIYYNGAGSGGYKISAVAPSGVILETIASYYTTSSQNNMTIYFAVNCSSAPSTVVIEIDGSNSGRLTRVASAPSLYYLDVNDIEYWQLLQYFNQYEYNNKLLERINSISVNITQNDINQMNTNITEYNSTMTDINQIENNYINNFNTLNNSIDLSNSSTPSVNLVNARTQFNSVFNDLTGDLRIKGILIVVLVCGLILILLGA